jgi:membrane-bound serine protease (ClpP class)
MMIPSKDMIFFGKEVNCLDASTGTLIMILCYVFGSGLVILEAFMPGFGVAGIAGAILEIAAIILTNRFFGVTWSIIATLLVLLFVGTAVFLSYRSAMKGRLSKSALILKETEGTESAAPSVNEWLDKEGTAVTALRPAGIIEIGGKRLNASTSGEFLSKGTSVRVVGVQGDHLQIRKSEV